MQIVHVFVEVKPNSQEEFQQATMANVLESRKEAGVLRFDFFQEEGSSTKFLLIEIYRDPDAAAAHKQTPHYATWRDAVSEMMSQPRYGIRYVPCGPSGMA